MKKEFTVKNFKVFDEDGATFDLAPITILTGCNSSGKSSMTKALLLLSKFVQKLKAEYKRTGECRPEDLTLGLPNQEMKLGNYNSILNCKASSNKAITLSYSQFNYIVDYIFEIENPVSDDGRLSEIVVKTNEGIDVLHIRFKNKGRYFDVDKINISVLKNDFFSLCSHQLLKKINSVFQSVDEEIITDVINNPGNSSISFCGWDIDSEEVATLLKQKRQLEKIIERQEQKGYDYENIRELPIGKIDEIELYQANQNSDFAEGRGSINAADVIDMLEYETLGCLPVFRLLEGVSKSETRKALMNKIQKEKYDAKSIEKWLSVVLDDFEQTSKYQTFLEYYIDKENKALSYPKEKTDGPIIIDNKNREYDTKSLFHIFNETINSENFYRVPFRHFPTGLDVDFGTVFDTLNELCINADMPSEEVGYLSFGSNTIPIFYRLFREYLSEWLIAVVLPKELEEDCFRYVNSNRADIRRIYSDSNEDRIGKSLNRYWKAQNAFVTKYNDILDLDKERFLNHYHWFEKFGIKGLDIKSIEEGAGFVVRLQQDGSPFEKGRLLADEGYGITQLVSVLIEIQAAIYISYLSEKKVPTTIIIEEPEIHLHPKYQSLLAEVFLDAYRRANIHFIIETHSEYLIRRLQTLVAEHNAKGSEGLDRNEISMYYLYSPVLDDRPEGEPQIKKIDMYEDGRLKTAFGSGFMDEVDKIFNHLLQIKTKKR